MSEQPKTRQSVQDRERIAIQRQQLAEAFDLQQRQTHDHQRILDLLDLHDLKDQLAGRGVATVHLELVGQDQVVVSELFDFQDRRIDDDVVQQLIEDRQLGFAKLTIQDVGYEPGDKFIFFDATGDPGDRSRPDLEEWVTRLHAQVFPSHKQGS